MAKSKIQWTDETDNVFVVKGEDGEMDGWYCEKVSEGCKHCYAERLNGSAYYGGNGRTYTRPATWMEKPEMMIRREILDGWMTKRAPKRRFINSMTDTFGEFIPDEWLDTLFAYMALSPTQTFQVLTKRAKRMTLYMNRYGVDERVERRMEAICGERGWCPPDLEWPLPNVWMMVSAENQQRFDERVPLLLQTPAKVRGVSIEPLLGKIFMHRYALGGLITKKLDWVIVGGESGPNARPMHPDWVRSIRDQCQGVPFFFKQWGAWKPISEMSEDEQDALYTPVREKYPDYSRTCKVETQAIGYDADEHWRMIDGHPSYLTFKVGKHRAGRLLDGREWNEFPTVAPSPMGEGVNGSV